MPDKKNKIPALLFGAVVLIGLVFLVIKAVPIQKPASPPTAQQVEKIKCVTLAFNDYDKGTLGLLQRQAALPLQAAMALTIERRRLQELFCLRFAGCAVTDPTNQSLALRTQVFESCLRDEIREEPEKK